VPIWTKRPGEQVSDGRYVRTGNTIMAIAGEVPMRAVILAAAVFIFFAGCTKLDYIGEEYPPTNHVDLYF
jgi:hypothetical protein